MVEIGGNAQCLCTVATARGLALYNGNIMYSYVYIHQIWGLWKRIRPSAAGLKNNPKNCVYIRFFVFTDLIIDVYILGIQVVRIDVLYSETELFIQY